MIRLLLILLLLNNIFALDLSSQYKRLKVIDDKQLSDKLVNTTVVFIPGILAETVIENSEQPINLSFLLGDYFRDQLEWCKGASVKCIRLILESEASVQKNTQHLKKLLSEIKGKKIIISHSKGGLEFLNLAILDPEGIKDVLGWITIQSPLRGSYLADIFKDSKILLSTTGWLFNFLGGSEQGITSLATEHRINYLKENHDKVKKILSSVRFINYASYIEDTEGVETILEISRDILAKKMKINDGLVELLSTRLDDEDFIIEEGVDHLATILDVKKVKLPFVAPENKNWNFDRVLHLKKLLELILEK